MSPILLILIVELIFIITEVSGKYPILLILSPENHIFHLNGIDPKLLIYIADQEKEERGKDVRTIILQRTLPL